jgi:hypothetical protein
MAWFKQPRLVEHTRALEMKTKNKVKAFTAEFAEIAEKN